ncbi:DUF2007 domain-containing protein [Granulicella sp. 5B5]|uniref:putative signal transducing protein n=1 Tax=Granulicella sp. 5B5 TaxID=1617967 RepID=UPI0015F36677|nr:DUF2007 domain-containing protein [Granulicella sp. 5B5]QMV19288.1 DUF2007 domain-containing protein [Granulicella sp. 5B5]
MSHTEGQSMKEHEGEFVTVATFPEPMEASVARSALEAAGIEVYLRGETANSMVPVAFAAELQVRTEDEAAAREVLQSAEDYEEPAEDAGKTEA